MYKAERVYLKSKEILLIVEQRSRMRIGQKYWFNGLNLFPSQA